MVLNWLMASRRAYADEYAVRVNRAVELLAEFSPADAADQLAVTLIGSRLPRLRAGHRPPPRRDRGGLPRPRRDLTMRLGDAIETVRAPARSADSDKDREIRFPAEGGHAQSWLGPDIADPSRTTAIGQHQPRELARRRTRRSELGPPLLPRARDGSGPIAGGQGAPVAEARLTRGPAESRVCVGRTRASGGRASRLIGSDRRAWNWAIPRVRPKRRRRCHPRRCASATVP